MWDAMFCLLISHSFFFHLPMAPFSLGFTEKQLISGLKRCLFLYLWSQRFFPTCFVIIFALWLFLVDFIYLEQKKVCRDIWVRIVQLKWILQINHLSLREVINYLLVNCYNNVVQLDSWIFWKKRQCILKVAVLLFQISTEYIQTCWHEYVQVQFKVLNSHFTWAS